MVNDGAPTTSGAITRQIREPMRALLDQLNKSQWWPAKTVRRNQFRQLALLLDHASATVRFYRDRLADARPLAGASLDESAWARVPILKRDTLRTATDSMRSNAVPLSHGKSHDVTTTGSTGMPVTITGTQHSALFWEALTLRDHVWQGRDFSGSMAAIRFDRSGRAAYPDGRAAAGWSVPSRWGIRTGPGALLSIETPVDKQAEWLVRWNPSFLITYPSNLEALARHCAQHGLRPAALRHVQTVSEAVGPAVRDSVRDAWDLDVRDAYSAQEVGYMALQAPGSDHYLVQAENVLLEVLDEADKPCPPGAVGRVVVTALHNFAMPLIRYDIGDWAEVGPASPCGRGLPVLTRILGRTRAMVTLPDGGRFWPFIRLEDLLETASVRQFQIVQKSLRRIELHLAVDHPLNADQEARLADIVRESLHHPFDVAVISVDSIARSAGGKYEDFRSEITA